MSGERERQLQSSLWDITNGLRGKINIDMAEIDKKIGKFTQELGIKPPL